MTLAEALIEKKELNNTIDSVFSALIDSVKIQEGDQVREDQDDLNARLTQTLTDIQKLTIAINRTNANTVIVFNDQTITLAIAIIQRDTLKRQMGFYNSIVERVTHRSERYSRNEIKDIVTIDPSKYREQYNKLAKQFRQLDVLIQRTNWNTDLID